MKIKLHTSPALSLIAVLLLQGCTFVASGAAGYLLKDKGYDVRSPVTHEQNATHR